MSFRSPHQLRSGAKVNSVPQSRGPADKRTDKKKPTDKKLQRSLSVPSASPTKTTTMADNKVDSAVIEHCVNSYLTSEDVIGRLISKCQQR